MIVDDAPPLGRTHPDEREPPRLLGLSVTAQHEMAGHQRIVLTERPHLDPFEAQGLGLPPPGAKNAFS